MVSESPLTPENASCGKPHSGPGTRGNSRNSTSMSGTDWARSQPAERSCARNGGSLRPKCRLSMVAVITQVQATM
ncbi:hypothetical protein D3C83_150550 [compost metagenome]